MLQKFALLVIMTLCLSVSCKKKSNPPSPASNPSPAMSATISGTAWTATTLNATNSGTDTISGLQASDSSTIVLLFPSGQSAGDTLKVGSESTVELMKSRTIYAGNSGSIVISSYSNNIIKGTFSATVVDINKDKISITGGSFTAKF